jgi:hypothetical protein
MVAANSDSVALMQESAETGDDGRLNHDQGQLFYSFCLDEAVPDDQGPEHPCPSAPPPAFRDRSKWV